MNPQQKKHRQRENRRKALKAEHRERRENKEREHFIEPLTGKRARHQAGAEAATEFNPILRAKSAEIRGSNQREHEIGNWYNELAQSNLTAQQNAIQAYTAAQSAQNQALQAAQAQGTASLQNLTANDAAAAARYGGPVNTTGLAGIAASNNELAAQGINQAGALNTQRANSVANMAGRINAAGLAGIKARGVQHRETQKLIGDRTAIQREKGQAKVANLGKLREGEQNRQTAKETFNYERGQNAQQAKTEAEERAEQAGRENRQEGRETKQERREEEERRENRTANKRQEEREEQELRNENFKTHHPGNGNGLTPSEKQTRKEHKNDAITTVKSLWPSVSKSKVFLEQPPGARWSLLEQLVREEGVAPHLAHWAVQRLRARVEGNPQGGIHR